MMQSFLEDGRDGHAVVEAGVLHGLHELVLLGGEHDGCPDPKQLDHADSRQVAHGLVIRDVQEHECPMLA